jgi:hypothetical protein
MKEYRIGFNMYKMIKEEKDTNGAWEKFMTYVKDEDVKVIVVLAGKDHMNVIFDPEAPDQIKEVLIQ